MHHARPLAQRVDDAGADGEVVLGEVELRGARSPGSTRDPGWRSAPCARRRRARSPEPWPRREPYRCVVRISRRSRRAARPVRSASGLPSPGSAVISTTGYSSGSTAAANCTSLRPCGSGWNVPAEMRSGAPGASSGADEPHLVVLAGRQDRQDPGAQVDDPADARADDGELGVGGLSVGRGHRCRRTRRRRPIRRRRRPSNSRARPNPAQRATITAAAASHGAAAACTAGAAGAVTAVEDVTVAPLAFAAAWVAQGGDAVGGRRRRGVLVEGAGEELGRARRQPPCTSSRIVRSRCSARACAMRTVPAACRAAARPPPS